MSTRGANRDHVVITGISGRLGRLVAKRLHKEVPIIGIDRRPFPGQPKDMVVHHIDIRRRKCEDLFRAGNIKALLHLGVVHDPRQTAEQHHNINVMGTARLLDYCAKYRVPKAVLLSSSSVYGPRPDNPQFLTEDAPLMAAERFHEMRDLIALDMLANSYFWKTPEVESVLLRPVNILGRVHNAPSNYLRLPRPPTLLGFDPMVQIIHERDMVEALVLALKPGIRGIFNVAGPGVLPLSAILKELGRAPVAIPHVLAPPALRFLWRYKLTSFPTPELDFIRFVCMVDDTRSRDILGFSPRYSLKETVHAVEAAS